MRECRLFLAVDADLAGRARLELQKSGNFPGIEKSRQCKADWTEGAFLYRWKRIACQHPDQKKFGTAGANGGVCSDE